MCVNGSQRPSKISDIKIHYVNDTLAYRKGNDVYLHEDLKNYPELFRSILKHEFEHDNKTFSLKDFFHDWKSGLPKAELKAFRQAHRDVALRMMLPINRFGINYNLIAIYILLVALTWGIMKVTLWIGGMVI